MPRSFRAASILPRTNATCTFKIIPVANKFAPTVLILALNAY